MTEHSSSIKELEILEKLTKVSLDDITTVTLNTDVLKHNFEVIIEILKSLSFKVNTHTGSIIENTGGLKELKEKVEHLEKKHDSDKKDTDNKINDTNSNVRDIKSDVDKNTQEIDKILQQLKDLKEAQDKLQNNNKDFLNDINQLKQKTEVHDKNIEDLFNSLAGAGGESVSPAILEFLKNDISALRSDVYTRLDACALKTDLDDLRKKFEDEMAELRKLLEQFVKKPDFESYTNKTDGSITDIYSILEELKKKVNEKLGCDSFDEHLAEFNNLKNLALSLSSGGDTKGQAQIIQSGPSLSTKDANLLKDLAIKFPELEALVKKIQKDLNDHLFTFKSFSDDTTKRFSANENNLLKLKDETNKKIKELEDLIKALGSGGAKPVVVSGDSSVEIKKILATLEEYSAKFDEHNISIRGAQSDIADLKQLKAKVASIQSTMDTHGNKLIFLEDEINELKNLKSRIEILEQLMKDSANKAKQIQSSRKPSVDGHGGGGVSIEQVKEIVNEEIYKLREELLALIEDLRALLDKKADADDLWKSEAALLEKLDQVAGALMKRSQSDKNDTKKALVFLEKKIKEVSIYLFGDPSQGGEDNAMFAKKPWNPWSCASCDNKLNHYPGPLIEHKSWNKLPARQTSPERMTQGKFGKGWGKWAETKKTTIEKVRESQTAIGGGRSTFESLPDIHKDPNAPNSHLESLRKNE